MLEECVTSGGIGEKTAAYITEAGLPVKWMICKNIGDKFVTHGDIDSLYRLCGIDGESVADSIIKELENEQGQA